MSGMFHINGDNEAKSCRAKTPEDCRFYRGDEDSRHYDNIGDAIEASTKLLANEHGVLKKQNKYSLLKDFQKKSKEFENEYSEVSNRFFNYDLRGKFLKSTDDVLDPKTIVNFSGWKAKGLSQRMALALTTPKDALMDNETFKEYALALNIENLHEADSETLSTLNANNALIGYYRGSKIVMLTPQYPFLWYFIPLNEFGSQCEQ